MPAANPPITPAAIRPFLASAPVGINAAAAITATAASALNFPTIRMTVFLPSQNENVSN
jgi:hypothetical protein